MIKNQVAILDKIGETAWAVVDEDGWLWRTDEKEDIRFFPSRKAARALLAKLDCQPDLRVQKVKLVLA